MLIHLDKINYYTKSKALGCPSQLNISLMGFSFRNVVLCICVSLVNFSNEKCSNSVFTCSNSESQQGTTTSENGFS